MSQVKTQEKKITQAELNENILARDEVTKYHLLMALMDDMGVGNPKSTNGGNYMRITMGGVGYFLNHEKYKIREADGSITDGNYSWCRGKALTPKSPSDLPPLDDATPNPLNDE